MQRIIRSKEQEAYVNSEIAPTAALVTVACFQPVLLNFVLHSIEITEGHCGVYTNTHGQSISVNAVIKPACC